MPVIKHRAQRVGVFIDTQNLYHSAKHLYKARVNFANVLAEAVGERTLVRAIAYVISTESGEESGFFDALTKIGIETKVKDLQVFADGAKKADWDVGLAMDAIKMAPKLDTIIIISGDGDYVPLVEYLKWGRGKEVEVAAFSRTTSSRLKEVADRFIEMENIPKILLKIRKKISPMRHTVNHFFNHLTLFCRRFFRKIMDLNRFIFKFGNG